MGAILGQDSVVVVDQIGARHIVGGGPVGGELAEAVTAAAALVIAFQLGPGVVGVQEPPVGEALVDRQGVALVVADGGGELLVAGHVIRPVVHVGRPLARAGVHDDVVEVAVGVHVAHVFEDLAELADLGTETDGQVGHELVLGADEELGVGLGLGAGHREGGRGV